MKTLHGARSASQREKKQWLALYDAELKDSLQTPRTPGFRVAPQSRALLSRAVLCSTLFPEEEGSAEATKEQSASRPPAGHGEGGASSSRGQVLPRAASDYPRNQSLKTGLGF